MDCGARPEAGRPLQGWTRGEDMEGSGERGVAVQVVRSREIPLRHLALGFLDLGFSGLGWRCNSGSFEPASPMTTQGGRGALPRTRA